MLAWPLVWTMLAVAQGVGAQLAGGSFIGISVPLGAHPWGIVNQPSVAFAATRAALWGYWLAGTLVAVAVALLLPTVVPVPDTWCWELFVFHLATASSVLGVGWASGCGVGDGPIAGLRTFWDVPTLTSLGVAAGVALATSIPAVNRLGGHLWTVPGGATRGRRVLVALLHGWVPWLLWIVVTLALGWPLSEWSIIGSAAAAVGCLIGALGLTPRAATHPRTEIGTGILAVTLFLGVSVSAALVWAGTPRLGEPLVILWGTRTMTNNIRPGWKVLSLRATPPPAAPVSR